MRRWARGAGPLRRPGGGRDRPSEAYPAADAAARSRTELRPPTTRPKSSSVVVVAVPLTFVAQCFWFCSDFAVTAAVQLLPSRAAFAGPEFRCAPPRPPHRRPAARPKMSPDATSITSPALVQPQHSTTDGEAAGRSRKSTFQQLDRPGAVQVPSAALRCAAHRRQPALTYGKIDVRGAFIVHEESSPTSRTGSPPRHASETNDIRLPHHKAEVSHIAVDVQQPGRPPGTQSGGG